MYRWKNLFLIVHAETFIFTDMEKEMNLLISLYKEGEMKFKEIHITEIHHIAEKWMLILWRG
jgi:hypothetical protein